MSRVQVKANAHSQSNEMRAKLASAARAGTNVRLKDLNTTGLSSAQIDTAIFGSSTVAQAADGLQITDKTNSLLLTRISGKWGSVTLTIIP